MVMKNDILVNVSFTFAVCICKHVCKSHGKLGNVCIFQELSDPSSLSPRVFLSLVYSLLSEARNYVLIVLF